MQITYLHRRPFEGGYSIETLFKEVRDALPPKFETEVYIMKYLSKGIFPRLSNAIAAAMHQGEVNHITGDIYYAGLFLKRRRTVLTILDFGTLRRLGGIKRLLFLLLWYWIPIKRAAFVTVISEAVKLELFRYIAAPKEKVHVVYCPISSAFRRFEKAFNKMIPTILQIGTTDNKNLIRLAKALKGIPCRLRIIGRLNSGQRAALVENDIAYFNESNLTTEEIVEAYKSCDLVVFASTYEGFGLPIVEANAVGRAVVTSSISSMPEVGGQAACYVDPYDVDSIRDGILRVIHNSDYRGEIIQSGFENVKRFAPAAIAEAYAKIYEKIVA